MIQAAAFAEEPAERQGAAALASEFLGESGVRDDLCARPAQRVDPADVVEVSVGEDEMRDLLVIRESQPGEGRADPRRGASGVDGDDSRAGADKREVGEVMALQHADGWLGLVDPGRGEPEAVPRGGPVAAELQSGVFGKTGEPGVADRRGCEIILAEHRVGPGEAVVRSADQGDRELVAYGQDESQVRHRPFRPLRVRREGGESLPAEILRQAEIPIRCPVQLGDRRVHVAACPGLEEPCQGEPERLARMDVGLLSEEPVAVGISADCSQAGSEVAAVAARASIAAASWLARIEPVTAPPRTAPSCRAVLSAPEAAPASAGGAACMPMVIMGAKIAPMPSPATSSTGAKVSEVARVDDTAATPAMPSA